MRPAAREEHFDLRALAATYDWAACCEILSSTHLPWEQPAVAPGSVDYRARIVTFGAGASVIDATCGRWSGKRGAREIANTRGEYIAIQLHLAGHQWMSQGREQGVIERGDLLVWDSEQRASFELLDRNRIRTLLLPRDDVVALCPDVERLFRVPRGATTGPALLLSSLLGAVAARHTTLDEPAALDAEAAVLELLRALLNPDARSDPAALRAGLRARAIELVEAHSAEPGFTPATLARMLGVSTRTLQVVFAERGDSPAAYLRRRRIARARRELARDPTHLVASVAARCGFGDPTHFARVFRRETGCTPSAWRAGDRPPSHARTALDAL